MKISIALITGAMTGIGRGAAIAFAGAGNRLVISGGRAHAGEALLRELRALGAESSR